MNDFTKKYYEAEDLLANVFDGDKNVARHLIWDGVTAIMDGYDRATQADILGDITKKILRSNNIIDDIYYPDDYDIHLSEYNELQNTFSAYGLSAWERQSQAQNLEKWMREYDEFVEQYRLGKDQDTVGYEWNELIELGRYEQLADAIEGFTVLHDELMPVIKKEIGSWADEYMESDQMVDGKALDKAYRYVRKLQADMIAFLKEKRTFICADEFCKRVASITNGRMSISTLDFPKNWGTKEFDHLLRALDFAADAHRGDTRKGTDIPYICHPIDAAIVTMAISDNVEVSVAALLHDVVEDTDYKLVDIERVFGSEVAKLVSYESEDKMKEMAAADSWKIRKIAFLDHLAKAPVDAQIICLGDKVSNMRLSEKVHKEKGDDMWLVFNQKDKNEQEWYYRGIYKNMPALRGTKAYKEYVKLCDKVFGK